MRNKNEGKYSTFDDIQAYVGKAFVSLRYIDLVVTHRVYKTHHKFMWFEWDTFKVKKTVPYIEDPLYDGDYATNRQLLVISKMLDAKSDEFLMNVSKGN